MNLDSNISQKIKTVPCGTGTISIENKKYTFDNFNTMCNYKISQLNYVRDMCIIVQDKALMTEICARYSVKNKILNTDLIIITSQNCASITVKVSCYILGIFDQILKGKSKSNIEGRQFLLDLYNEKNVRAQWLKQKGKENSIESHSACISSAFLYLMGNVVCEYQMRSDLKLKPSDLINLIIEPEIDEWINKQVDYAKPRVQLIFLSCNFDDFSLLKQIPKEVNNIVCKILCDLACHRGYRNIFDF